VITTDERIYRRAQQLRADSRRYRSRKTAAGEMEIVEDGEVMGANYCLSELHAAVLCDQLGRLDEQHEHRERQAALLEKHLAALGDFGPVPVPEQADRRSIYEYAIRFRPGTFGPAAAERVAAAVGAELDLCVYAPDDPLHASVLFRPHTKRRFGAVWTEAGRQRATDRPYPGAHHYRNTTLLFHHSALLGEREDVEDIAAALAKVRDTRAEL
jgi:L-glutamine:2-deoxy-scyllo-inosose/3-amino-2,3-dideoxy-scyllo-inosose aminotransferase